jgi:hypothetical protein
MNRTELLEQLFCPFVAILSINVWAGSFLVVSVGWLVACRVLKLNMIPCVSSALWWLIIGLAFASAMLAVVLFFLAPYGPDGYKFVFSLFVVVPLVVAAAIVWFCKPT